MNYKAFINIILKILGVYLTIQALTLLPEYIGTMAYVLQDSELWSTYFIIVSMLLTYFIYYLIIKWLIFKTDKIVEKITSGDDKTDHELIHFRIHRSTVLKISIIVIGGLTIISEIPTILEYLVQLLVGSEYEGKLLGTDLYTTKYFIRALIKLGIGLYLVFYSNMLVNWIELKRRKA